jgi:hypothetical protein
MKASLHFLFLFLSLHCFSQQKDYLVKINGDSVFGKIRLKNKIFSVTTGESSQTIKSNEVKLVSCNNYKGTIVVNCNLQLYNDDLSELEMGWADVKASDTVMILQEVYNTPKINLYLGTDDFKRQYYFYKTPLDSFPVQLVVRYHLGGGLTAYAAHPEENRGERAKVHLEEDKGYVNQLMMIMGDCGKIPEGMWEILTYREYSLKQLIKRYNRCK